MEADFGLEGETLPDGDLDLGGGVFPAPEYSPPDGEFDLREGDGDFLLSFSDKGDFLLSVFSLLGGDDFPFRLSFFKDFG